MSSRDRILETAWKLVLDEGPDALTMGRVAKAGGVSRQMMYLHFENRAGLFTAMARHHDRRSGFFTRVEQTFALEPVPALEALLRAWLAYVPEILPVARALHAAALTGAEGGAAWHDRMQHLHDAFRSAVARVDLAPGWTPDRAADWIWSRAHIAVWEAVVVQQGWPEADFAERTVRSALDEILAA